MELKTRVIRISVSVGCIIAVSLIGYLAYFIITDTLKAPPENKITRNLFIEKDSIDIAALKNAETLRNCIGLYNSVLNSIYEDHLNNFLGENKKENDLQLKILWKMLNYVYIEQFIALAQSYFTHSNWNDNSFVNQCIKDIYDEGFVERNTPNWSSLQGFEMSITWYTNMQNCIKSINKVIYWETYFSSDNLSALKQRKNNLLSQICIKNINKVSELNNSYENLENESKSYLSSKIEQYDEDFDNSDKYNYRSTAYQKYNELRNEVEQWNSVFYNSSELNEQLQRHRTRLDIYYY